MSQVTASKFKPSKWTHKLYIRAFIAKQFNVVKALKKRQQQLNINILFLIYSKTIVFIETLVTTTINRPDA